MLVLSRKKSEVICIGDIVTIVVVEIRGDKVRLGIEAPRGIPVHRQEVYLQIQEEGGVDRKNDLGPLDRLDFNANCDGIG